MASPSAESEMTDADCPMLPSEYHAVPLDALKSSSRRKLSMFLNLEGQLNEEVGVMSNYEGLAEKVGFSYMETCNFGLERNKATDLLLQEWSERPEQNPSIGALWTYLGEMERLDVLTEIRDYIKRDCESYLKMKSHFKPSKPVQVDTVTQSTDKMMEDDRLAVPDVTEGTRTIFDAFVCYNPEGDDLEFVKLLIEKVEEQEKLKLFVPWRDDLPGTSQHTVCAQLIEQRCRRVIIILSPRFLTSPSCDFQIKFAQHLSPGARDKKLIPILIERCNIPEILRFVTNCDYTKKDLHPWFWKRLITALERPLPPTDISCQQTQSLSLVSLDTSSEVLDWSLSSSSTMSSMSSSSSSSSSSSQYTSGASSSLPSDSSCMSSSSISGQSLVSSDFNLGDSCPAMARSHEEYDRIGNVKKGSNSSNSTPHKERISLLSRLGFRSPRLQKKTDSNTTTDKKKKESPKKEKKDNPLVVHSRELNTVAAVQGGGAGGSSSSRVVIASNVNTERLDSVSTQQNRRPVPPIPQESHIDQAGNQQMDHQAGTQQMDHQAGKQQMDHQAGTQQMDHEAGKEEGGQDSSHDGDIQDRELFC